MRLRNTYKIEMEFRKFKSEFIFFSVSMEIQNRFPTNFESGTVVIFGGSFDPVTYTHIQVASEVLNFGLADQVCIDAYNIFKFI